MSSKKNLNCYFYKAILFTYAKFGIDSVLRFEHVESILKFSMSRMNAFLNCHKNLNVCVGDWGGVGGGRGDKIGVHVIRMG